MRDDGATPRLRTMLSDGAESPLQEVHGHQQQRKDIILHNLGSGFKKLIVAEDDRLNVRSFEDKDVSLHYLARKLVSMFLWSKERNGE